MAAGSSAAIAITLFNPTEVVDNDSLTIEYLEMLGAKTAGGLVALLEKL